MLKFCILIIILLLFLCLIPSLSDLHMTTCPKYKSNDIYNTGDLILFRTTHGSILKKNSNLFNFNYVTIGAHLLCGYYTHVAMIIVYNNIPYLYECNPYNVYSDVNFDNFTQKLVQLSTPTLLDISYLYKYDGFVFHLPYIGPKISDKLIFQVLNFNKNIKLNPMQNINQCFKFNNVKNYKAMGCVSFIIQTLNKLKIISEYRNCINPTQLSKLLLNSNKYDNIIYSISNNIT